MGRAVHETLAYSAVIEATDHEIIWRPQQQLHLSQAYRLIVCVVACAVTRATG